jgi:rRNA maturation endonuclease Nob1
MIKSKRIEILQCMKCGIIYDEPEKHECPPIRHLNTRIVINHLIDERRINYRR